MHRRAFRRLGRPRTTGGPTLRGPRGAARRPLSRQLVPGGPGRPAGLRGRRSRRRARRSGLQGAPATGPVVADRHAAQGRLRIGTRLTERCAPGRARIDARRLRPWWWRLWLRRGATLRAARDEGVVPGPARLAARGGRAGGSGGLAGCLQGARIAWAPTLLCGLLLACGAPVDDSGPTADWPAYGATSASQVLAADPDHAAERRYLEIAWVHRHGDVSDGSGPWTKTSFQVTPIVAGGRMFICTASRG